MTLGEVKAQFTSLMNRTDLKNNTSLVSTFINQAIRRIQRELRVPMMEKSIVATIGASYNGLIIPSDYLELISMEYTSSFSVYQLQREQLTKVKTAAITLGDPLIFCRQGSKWWLGPSPAAGAKVRFDYYAAFPQLTDDTQSNILTQVAPDAIIYGALSAACDYYNDERSKQFEGRYTQITTMLQEQADGDELTADASVQPALIFDDGL